VFIFLPPSDLARQQGISVLWDPFVLTVMLPVVFATTLIGTAFSWFLLRDRNLLKSGLLIFGLVLVEFILTGANPLGCILGGPVVALAAMSMCRASNLFAVDSEARRSVK
jgi:hypothetical protein